MVKRKQKMLDSELNEFASAALVALGDIMAPIQYRSSAKKSAAKEKTGAKKAADGDKRRTPIGVSQGRIQIYYVNAQHYVKERLVLKHLCPALKNFVGD